MSITMERLTMAPPPAAAESLTTAATLFSMGTNTTTSLNSSLDFHFVLDGNIQTLSTHSAPGKGPIQGLLYVPSLDSNDPCNDILAPYVPSNVTRKEDVEPIGHHSIALAPWVSVDCTQLLLEASRMDKPDALVFYLPHTSSTKMPPPSDDPAWVLGDNSQWMDQNEYPVYAIPASAGATLMQRLSWYSGNTTIAPNSSLDDSSSGHDGSVSHASENVRLFTFIDLAKDDKKMPSLWGFVLAILGTILVLSILILLLYQIVQKKRRERLQRRIETGDVDLEFLGLNQMKVPREVLDQLPKYTYPEPNTPPEAVLNATQTQNTKFYADGRGAITTIREESEEETAAAAAAASTDDNESHVQRPQPAAIPTTATTTTTSAIAPDQGIPSTTSKYRFSYSQTTCAICLDDYEPGLSIVREMPCGHIFDVDCIDTFLTQGSSLCPLCKKSVLPAGSYPIPVTNIMVQRDYIQRRSH